MIPAPADAAHALGSATPDISSLTLVPRIALPERPERNRPPKQAHRSGTLCPFEMLDRSAPLRNVVDPLRIPEDVPTKAPSVALIAERSGASDQGVLCTAKGAPPSLFPEAGAHVRPEFRIAPLLRPQELAPHGDGGPDPQALSPRSRRAPGSRGSTRSRYRRHRRCRDPARRGCCRRRPRPRSPDNHRPPDHPRCGRAR